MFTDPSFSGTVSGVTKAMVGLSNVDNQSKTTMFTSPTFTGTIAGSFGGTVENTFNVSNSGSSDYVFAQDDKFFPTNVNDPVLYLRRGETYKFIVNASGHPFEIRVSNGGSAYNTGVTNNTQSNATITFVVPMSAPATLYYQCTAHSGMGNTINIV
jgi:plastocyanin